MVGRDRGCCRRDGRSDRPHTRARGSTVGGGRRLFLVIMAAVVAGLAWLGWFLTRRLRRRSAAPAGQKPRPS
ncbi:MAG: hypothetical protein K0R13_126 [Propionibacteriaceae bacterium]|nr:hypothetical protein [Propionibacteriaceae bacterium]